MSFNVIKLGYRAFFKAIKSPELAKLFFDEIRQYGLRSAIKKSYKVAGWKRNYTYTENIDEEGILKEIESFRSKPLISIVTPTYNTDVKWLAKLVESVENQFYDNWEWLIADDASSDDETKSFLRNLESEKIHVVFQERNGGISAASNAAAEMATGDYITFLDHDDELTRDALFEVAKRIDQEEPDLVYSDEDTINDVPDHFLSPVFKPDYSPDLLLSFNYITHLFAMRMSIFKELKGFDSRFDGSQDFDLTLRATEKAKTVAHIPKVLYHWRRLPSCTSVRNDTLQQAHAAGKIALEEALKRRNIAGEVTMQPKTCRYRVKRDIRGNPLISIIIPFKDKTDLLETCVKSILDKTTYENYEILCVDNGSLKSESRHKREEMDSGNDKIRFLDFDEDFNFSKINNFAVKHAAGQHIVLLNNDTRVISAEWLTVLLEHSQREDVGAVGASLYYSDETLQHAGLTVGADPREDKPLIGAPHRGRFVDHPGLHGRMNYVRNVTAITAACMMVEKRLYQDLGGMDEQLGVAFNDVDFCLRLRKNGLLNIFTPFCELYHDESKSRGYEDSPEKQKRFERELAILTEKHHDVLNMRDPYLNPNVMRYGTEYLI